MEKIQSKRQPSQHKNNLVLLIDALNTSIRSLEGYKRSTTKARARQEPARRAPPTTTTTTTDLPFQQGHFSTAIHPALSDLYIGHDACLFYVVIDGNEEVYANPQFEQTFYPLAECNQRLKIGEGQSPINAILSK